MYYPDLSLYTYIRNDEPYPTLNIGWLDGSHIYPNGQVSETFLDRLWIYCQSLIYLSLGYHECDFCHEDLGVSVWNNGKQLVLGSAEIRVIGKRGIAYAAPNMIYHYIVDHQYLPPSEFIQAVLESPLPKESAEYQNRYGEL